LVEGEVVLAKASVEVKKSSRHKMAVFRGKKQTDIVNDSGANGLGVLLTMVHQYEGQGDNKEERAEGVPLRNPLFQGVADSVVYVEGRMRVGSEVHAGGIMVEETEPGGQSGAVNVLYSVPDVLAQDVVKSLLQITWDKGAAQLSRNLGSLDELLASARDRDTKVKVWDEVESLALRESLQHHHVCSNTNKGFGNAKVAQLDSGALGVFVEEAAFQISGPVSQPRQAATRKVFYEGTKDGPVGVGVLVVFESSRQIGKELYPRKPEARNARWWCGWAAANVSVYGLAIKGAPTIESPFRNEGIRHLFRVEGRQLVLGFRGQGANGLLAIHHLHGVVKVEITGEASSSFSVLSQLLKAGSGVRLGRCKRVAWLGGFRPGNVAVDIAIGLGEGGECMQRSLSKFFTPEIVDANRDESGKVFVADACGGCWPINEGRVGELFRESRWASRLETTEYGANGEAFSMCKIAIRGAVRGALAGRAGGWFGVNRRKRSCAFAIARKFVGIDAGQNFGSVGVGWADRERENSLRRQRSKQIHKAVLSEQFVVGPHMWDKNSIEGAKKRNDAVNSVIEQAPTLVSAAEAISSKSKLTKFFAISSDVKGLSVSIACIDEGIFESESLSQHAAVLRMGVVVLGINACLWDVVMMAKEGATHVAVSKAAISANGRIDTSEDLSCIIECRCGSASSGRRGWAAADPVRPADGRDWSGMTWCWGGGENAPLASAVGATIDGRARSEVAAGVAVGAEVGSLGRTGTACSTRRGRRVGAVARAAGLSRGGWESAGGAWWVGSDAGSNKRGGLSLAPSMKGSIVCDAGGKRTSSVCLGFAFRRVGVWYCIMNVVR
jgi:hypothetical protein